MLNYFNLLEVIDDGQKLCDSLEPVLRVVGIVVLGIKIVVPIILIIIGMIDLAKAVGQKDENEIKKAQNLLIKKAIAAVIVFLVITFVQIIMAIIGNDDYKQCMKCINTPFQCKTVSDDGSGKVDYTPTRRIKDDTVKEYEE